MVKKYYKYFSYSVLYEDNLKYTLIDEELFPYSDRSKNICNWYPIKLSCPFPVLILTLLLIAKMLICQAEAVSYYN